ncbi:hypothetical protein NADE_005791 [Nannochloris sp. 'desiccata']|nr:hypothetical protein NADE_005791 [Chlorella desiccata (nom. nud.)]
MSAMSNSVGEGIDSGFGDKFVNTGYGTYNGQGNARTGAEEMKGTGYDEHGQVKTQFGKWPISYEPVTGTATTGVTSNYDFPPGHLDPGDVGGLTDVSIPAEGHSTMGVELKAKEKVDGTELKPDTEAEAGQGGPSSGGGELEKAEIRAAFDDTAEEEGIPDGQEQVGRHKNGRIVAIASGGLFFFGMGTGEYNELAVSEVLKTLIDAYKEIFKAPELTDAILLQNYPHTILVVDEVCKEGLPEHMDRASIIKSLSFKLPTFSTDGEKNKSLMSRLSS